MKSDLLISAKRDTHMTHFTHAAAAASETRSFVFVVLAYRCLMAELSGKNSKHQHGAWEALEAAAPPGQAEALFGHMFGFARALLTTAGRPLDWRKPLCAHLCRDEWLAIAMIDAAQRADISALLGASAELIGVDALGEVLNATQGLAAALAQRGLFLCPRSTAEGCDLCPKRTLH